MDRLGVVWDDEETLPTATSVIVADPEDFYGDRVAVSRVIRDRFGSDAFTIGARELLVVEAGGLPDDAGPGGYVVVLGTVERPGSEVSDDVLGTASDADLFASGDERPAVYASQVVVEPDANAG